MKLKEEFVDVDLSNMRKLAGKLVPGEPKELYLIEIYKHIENDEDNFIDRFTNYLLKFIYMDNVDREYSEIVNFYNEKYYLHTIVYFREILTALVINKIDPNFVDILFNKYVENGVKLIVRFKILRVDKDER